MIRAQDGFTLTELLITMAVFVVIIAAASGVFTGLLTQYKQQSKIAESNIEGLIGLEMLRRDLEHAGYGLPWSFQNPINYSEAVKLPASTYNDAPDNPPRPIASGNDTGINGSDYLVIKAVNIARNKTSEKWTVLQAPPFNAPFNPRTWIPSTDNLVASDRVIIISPGATGNMRSIIMQGSSFFTTFKSITSSPWPPADATEHRVVYGVDPDTDLRMPFNRADFFIVDAHVPKRCAPNTGILEKAVLNQNGGGFNFLPLLDCVADFQVIYRLDMNIDGTIGTIINADGSNVISSEGSDTAGVQATLQSAAGLRERIKEVRVYVLSHEGQKDFHYSYPDKTISVGETGAGRTFSLDTVIGKDWQHYRWKVYTMIVKPNNLK